MMADTAMCYWGRSSDILKTDHLLNQLLACLAKSLISLHYSIVNMIKQM